MTFVILPLRAQAADYQAGTVGYLYEDCKAALKKSGSLAAFDARYCGGFAEGYTMGLIVSNGITLGARPGDPCAKEMEKEYERINHRFCAYLPDYAGKDIGAVRQLAPAAAEIVARWVEFRQHEKGKDKKDPLQQPVTEINDILKPGAFCESLGRYGPYTIERPGIAPQLAAIDPKDFMTVIGGKTISAKYAQCKADLTAAKGDAMVFAATRCGAEIAGFITGLRSTEHLQDRRPAQGKCAKQAERLYKNLDTAKTMCVTPDTKLEDVAKVFLERTDSLQNNSSAPAPEFSLLGGYGAVGYQSIYYGFLCKKDLKKMDAK